MPQPRWWQLGPTVLSVLALGACAGSVPSVVGRPCGTESPCPSPAVCDFAQGVCVMPPDRGVKTPPDGPIRDGTGVRPDTTHVDSFVALDGGCPAPLTNCSGFCVNLGTDVANCNGCGKACLANQTCHGSCVCKVGWGDCDGNAFNGCEAQLGSDVDNCGACGVQCGASATCTGTCVCTGGAFNCDGSWSNGCECAEGCSGTQCKAKAPNWSNCSGDGDCTSQWCGCNGGTIKQCLPDQTYPKTCGAGLPNWSNCGGDGDCTSQWCGCNGGTIKQCLPNQTYPKTCS